MKKQRQLRQKIGNRSQKLCSAQVTFLQTKTMFFYQLKAIGVLYIKSLVHSNPYFRFFQGPKCMLALRWVLHLFSFRLLLLFRFFLFLALDV